MRKACESLESTVRVLEVIDSIGLFEIYTVAAEEAKCRKLLEERHTLPEYGIMYKIIRLA